MFTFARYNIECKGNTKTRWKNVIKEQSVSALQKNEGQEKNL